MNESKQFSAVGDEKLISKLEQGKGNGKFGNVVLLRANGEDGPVFPVRKRCFVIGR